MIDGFTALVMACMVFDFPDPPECKIVMVDPRPLTLVECDDVRREPEDWLNDVNMMLFERRDDPHQLYIEAFCHPRTN